MRLLWQQILGVMTVLIVALGLSAFLISQVMEKEIYHRKQQELIQYGMNIVENQFTRTDLEKAYQLMADEEIVIQVFLADGTIIYPSFDQRNKLQLSDDQLIRITNDESIGIQRSVRYDRNGQRVNMATVYISNKGGYQEFPEGFIGVGAPLSDLDEQIASVQRNIMIGFGVSAFIGILMTIIYAMYQSKRIQRLQQATRQIVSGNYELTLVHRGHDELADLAQDFQLMADSLRASNEEIERQEMLRRQMMMDAAHEMRTPLTTMNGVLEGLSYDMIPEEQKARSLALVLKETQRLIRLVNENLDYEKIRNQEIVLRKQWLNISELFEQIILQLNEKAKAKGNYITSDVEKNLMIHADYDRMIQILMNITINAIQFSDDSEIRLIAKAIKEGVEIHIQDFGIGISVDKIKNIWERFYKADISRKNTEFGESGIGLAVVKSLVEAHGGTVEVESQLGVGTTFILKFMN